ncbi:hypothetical protein B0H13DRAFT_1851417 [Mycena leptocephala]|nr:hypothetical protein B0H13DRAFT_1851417 [Mycena leptocephala]
MRIPFDPVTARIRCMPHTAHLAAIKLLEAIGAISKSARKKAEGKGASYQDSVTASLAREDDDGGEEDYGKDGDDEMDGDGGQGGQGQRKLKSVKKLRSIIRSIRGSPQRRQAWIAEVRASTAFKAGKLGKQPLMLILDVKTRWSSTHQMLLRSQFILGRAIDHRQVITDFVGKHRDLHQYDLDVNDWESIVLVTGWLKSFRTATTLMSTTKRPMLSYTHAIFRGLQVPAAGRCNKGGMVVARMPQVATVICGSCPSAGVYDRMLVASSPLPMTP